MKDWISYNWKFFAWGLALIILCAGTIVLNEKLRDSDPLGAKEKQLCLEKSKKVINVSLETIEPTITLLGNTNKYSKVTTISVVWKLGNDSKITCICETIRYTTIISSLVHDGEDLTDLIGREERK